MAVNRFNLFRGVSDTVLFARHRRRIMADAERTVLLAWDQFEMIPYKQHYAHTDLEYHRHGKDVARTQPPQSHNDCECEFPAFSTDPLGQQFPHSRFQASSADAQAYLSSYALETTTLRATP
jgi:hypothetical protein